MSTNRHVLGLLPASAAVGLVPTLALAGCTGGEGEAQAEETAAIVFTVNRDGHQEIWVMDPDGGNRTRLTEQAEPGVDASGSAQPAWSPDGRRIAFVSDRSNPVDHENEIWVIGADGDGLHRLTTNDVWDLEPAWR